MKEANIKRSGVEKIENSDTFHDFYYVKYDDNGKEENRTKRYSIDYKEKCIKVYPTKGGVTEVEIKGFTKIPKAIVNDKGILQHGLLSLFEYRIEKTGSGIKKVIIEIGIKNAIKKVEGEDILFLNFKDFEKLKNRIVAIRNKSTKDVGKEIDTFLHDKISSEFEAPAEAKLSSQKKAELIITNLDESVIEHFTPDKIETFIDFFGLLVDRRYKTDAGKKKILEMAQIKIKDVPFTELLVEFEENLKTNPLEAVWSKFMKNNLFLIDPSYIHAFPELHVTLGTGKRVDFGLVDLKGYLDIFEIKRSGTKLISDSPDSSHGNYYWHSDAVKAITQAEKYLHNVERKAANLAEDIAESSGHTVSVIKPKVILLMGNTGQFKNKAQENDFRILRNSLKNIEIILYDELFERVKILASGKTYLR